MLTKTDPKEIIAKVSRSFLLAAALGISVTAVIIFLNKDNINLNFIKTIDKKIWYTLFFMTVVAWLSKGLRLFTILKALQYPAAFTKSFMISISTEFAVAATPAGFGGSAVQFAFLSKTGLPFAEIISITSVEGLIDLVLFVLLFFPLFFFFFGRDTLENVLGLEREKFAMKAGLFNNSLAIIVLIIIVLLVITISYILNSKSKKAEIVRKFIRKILSELASSLRCTGKLFGQRKAALLTIGFLSFVQWICRYGVLPLLAYSLGAQESVFLLFLVQGVFISIGHLLFLPGGSGGVELMMSAALSLFLPVELIGLTIIIWRFFTYYMYLFCGGLIFGISVYKFDNFAMKNI